MAHMRPVVSVGAPYCKQPDGVALHFRIARRYTTRIEAANGLLASKASDACVASIFGSNPSGGRDAQE